MHIHFVSRLRLWHLAYPTPIPWRPSFSVCTATNTLLCDSQQIPGMILLERPSKTMRTTTQSIYAIARIMHVVSARNESVAHVCAPFLFNLCVGLSNYCCYRCSLVNGVSFAFFSVASSSSTSFLCNEIGYVLPVENCLV